MKPAFCKATPRSPYSAEDIEKINDLASKLTGAAQTCLASFKDRLAYPAVVPQDRYAEQARQALDYLFYTNFGPGRKLFARRAATLDKLINE